MYFPDGFRNRNRKVLPMEHVVADGMAPTHVSPDVALGIVLIEEVVLALVKDESVGIVHEIFSGREVILRTPGLVVCRLR